MRRRAVSAATISRPHPAAPPSVTVPMPLYTRHTLGAIEAARDHRRQARDRPVGEIDRRADEGGHLALGRMSPAS
jgi:hypothetical protein